MYEQFNSRPDAGSLPKISIFNLKRWGFMKQMYDSFYLFLGDYGAYSSKIRVEVFLFDNDRSLLFKEALTEGNYLHLCDPQGGDYFEQKVRLCSTTCNFGGYRYWLSCPSCNRMVGVIYFLNGQFACRRCHNLTYRIRNLNRFDRTLQKIISMPELEQMETKIKRKVYKGRYTKKYNQFLQKALRSRITYATSINSRYNKWQSKYRQNTRLIQGLN